VSYPVNVRARSDVLWVVTFRVDTWTPDGESIVEHVAGVEDYQVAVATFRAACERPPGTPITLRQGARVIEDSRRLRAHRSLSRSLQNERSKFKADSSSIAFVVRLAPLDLHESAQPGPRRARQNTRMTQFQRRRRSPRKCE
jgi:hypothetical protein